MPTECCTPAALTLTTWMTMSTHFQSHDTSSACTLSYASTGCIMDLFACPLKHSRILPFDSSKHKLSGGTTATQIECLSTDHWLLELNKEVMQFALEEERKHAAAWVCNTTGVEEWGKDWLVVDGTHIPLAWKPGVCSQERFCYKGFHSMNVALVILPHLLQIVKLVVGQPGSVQDLKVWASGSNILKKPRVMGLDTQEVRRPVNSYEGSTGIKESGRS
ncbi:uncharacterized protein UDID_17419 [Ustilago sp. UG-2017a]|nr:uncharacterized protein UDID_17419 [Ustilago sp. UG-2017a]